VSPVTRRSPSAPSQQIAAALYLGVALLPSFGVEPCRDVVPDRRLNASIIAAVYLMA
jgi:hypothetical protein